ncbi:hypothetical protein RIB2604_02500470 [Aspergillus luchuensis]|uniref:Uncharacterized protein n=1 Tax=Aspergillus kawachii TaxID=1069201 RepID=A0A146FS51_ASPKA|nr:hypothetical protein RIB2604_02500470 [Aspergillus luchuensis]
MENSQYQSGIQRLWGKPESPHNHSSTYANHQHKSPRKLLICPISEIAFSFLPELKEIWSVPDTGKGAYILPERQSVIDKIKQVGMKVRVDLKSVDTELSGFKGELRKWVESKLSPRSKRGSNERGDSG